MALPTITPSARSRTAFACSGVEIPTPNTSGTVVRSRIRSDSARAWALLDERSPVTPISATP